MGLCGAVQLLVSVCGLQRKLPACLPYRYYLVYLLVVAAAAYIDDAVQNDGASYI